VRTNSDTILFAVLGDPVSHSLGPLMHNTAFSELEYNGSRKFFAGERGGGRNAPAAKLLK
jgi:shikimate 5-dehydrogenase